MGSSPRGLPTAVKDAAPVHGGGVFCIGKGACRNDCLCDAADYSPPPRVTPRGYLDTERGAAWLAHQSGGLGVVGSNPAAPTK